MRRGFISFTLAVFCLGLAPLSVRFGGLPCLARLFLLVSGVASDFALERPALLLDRLLGPLLFRQCGLVVGVRGLDHWREAIGHHFLEGLQLADFFRGFVRFVRSAQAFDLDRFELDQV